MKIIIILIELLIHFPLFLNAQATGEWRKMELTEETLHFLLSNNYSFGGIVNPTAKPPKGFNRAYYLAGLSGEYRYFGNISLAEGESVVVCRCDNSELLNIEQNVNKERTPYLIKLSSCNLHNEVITKENGWKESFSDITVLSDYIQVSKGTEYAPHSLGDYRLTIYHYDKDKNFLDITSWFTLKEPFISLGDYVRIGIRKRSLSKITPMQVKKQDISFDGDTDKMLRLNIGNRSHGDSLHLVFEDEFNFYDSTKWEIFDSFNPSFSLDCGAAPYRSKNVFVSNGNLVIRAQKEKSVLDNIRYHYTTGLVDSKGKFNINSGRVDIRMKADYCPDFNAGLWLNPQFGRWPEGQEIDIVEITKENYASGALHYTHAASFMNTGKPVSDDVVVKPFTGKANLLDWHVWSCEWNNYQIRFYCDNILYGIVNSSEIRPDIPFDKSAKYLVLSYGLHNSEKKRLQSYRMYIDWVRVYSNNDENKLSNLYNQIVLDYDMQHPLTMKKNEWRGIYPTLSYNDGSAMSKLELKIIKDDDNILSLGNTNMVIYSHGVGSATCEVIGNGMSKQFRVVVQ